MVLKKVVYLHPQFADRVAKFINRLFVNSKIRVKKIFQILLASLKLKLVYLQSVFGGVH